MNDATTAQDRLTAEAISAPWRDPALSLAPGWSARPPPTFLATAAHLHLSNQAEAIWRLTWPTRHVAPLHALCTQAAARLERSGDVHILRVDPDAPTRATLAWRWLSLRMPARVLALAADAADRATPPRPATDVRLLDPAIAPQHPTAHLHLHTGAAFDEASLWHDICTNPQLQLADADVPAPFVGRSLTGDTWTGALLACGLAERALQAHHATVGPVASADANALAATLCAGTAQRNEVAAAFEALTTVAGTLPGPVRPSSAHLSWQLGRAVVSHYVMRERDEPPAQLLDQRRRAVLRAIASDASGAGHGFAHALQLAVLRVRCALHDHLVHDPFVADLGVFVARFGRLRAYRAALGADAAMPSDDAASPSWLRSVELREGPPRLARTAATMVGRHEALHRGDAAFPAHQPAKERGIIVHFSRTPRAHSHPLALSAIASSHADAMARTLDVVPRLARTYRGVDLAGDERAGPLLLFVSSIRTLRAAIDRAAACEDVRGAGLTLHAGESYASPWTGLRAVDEPFLWGLMRPGDRLGHATILGGPVTDPPGGCEFVQPRIERVLDLCWLLHRSADARASLLPTHGFAHPWRRELAELLRGAGCDDDVEQAVRAYGEGIDATLPDQVDGRRDWLTRWLHGCSDAFDAPVCVPMDDAQLNLAEGARLQLLRRIAAMRVAIEVNPSSNLILAGLSTPLAQPSYGALPAAAGTAPTVPITISTDDPICFATSLADEIAYAWAGGVHRGEDPERMRLLIDAATRNAWAFRFTLAGSPESAQSR